LKTKVKWETLMGAEGFEYLKKQDIKSVDIGKQAETQ
jgi:hypothetical protein